MTLRPLLTVGVCALPMLVGTAAAQDTDPVVASVGEHEIHMSDVQEAIEALPAQYRQLPPEVLVPSIAEQIAIGRLIEDRGYEAGLRDDAEVQDRLALAERAIVQEVWLERAIAEQVTDDRLDAAYEQFLADNPPGTETRARHILVETEEDARSLIAQLDEGGDFEALAEEHSIGPSGTNGGDLGYFTIDQMVPAFGETAFALEPGSYTADPVETQFGFHVILVEDRRDVEPPTFDEVEGQLRDTARQEVTREIVTGLREGAEITFYGPDGEPLPDPGESPE